MSLLSNANLGRINKIRNWLDVRFITNYKIDPKTFEIDVYDSVYLFCTLLSDDPDLCWVVGRYSTDKSKVIDSLPEYIQFRNVYGNFDISRNNLGSLRGCPKWVQKHFNCSNNKLESLEGLPENVGSLSCHSNMKNFDLNNILKISNIKEISKCKI